MKILVVEDDEKIRSFLQRGLEEQGYSVEAAIDGEEGLYFIASQDYEVIILDLGLPKIDGFEILRDIRGRGLQTPVICLTARDHVDDRVKGLQGGADDYMVKPFALTELLARIHVVSRRGKSQDSSRLGFEDIEMDLLARKVMRGGSDIDLTSKEFSILEYFLRNPERVLTRTVIGERIWGADSSIYSNVIDVHVMNLRKKIDKDGEKKVFHTIKNVGYVLKK